MTENKESVSWEEATASAGFIKFEEREKKELVISEYKLEEVNKFGKESIEFVANVIEEDGNTCDKLFTTTSKRLKTELRKVLDGKDLKKGPIKFTVMKVGKSYNTEYAVEEVKGE